MKLINSSMSIGDTDIIKAEFEPGKDYGNITFYSKDYSYLQLEIHVEQVKKLIEVIEGQLYEITSQENINGLESQIARLENELEDKQSRIEFLESRLEDF